MVEKPERAKVPSGRRAPEGREWEVFLRNDGDSTLRHVGSVRALSPDQAHESATRLFGWYATDIWVVAADDVHRFAAESLSDDAEPATPGDDEADADEERTVEF